MEEINSDNDFGEENEDYNLKIISKEFFKNLEGIIIIENKRKGVEFSKNCGKLDDLSLNIKAKKITVAKVLQ